MKILKEIGLELYNSTYSKYKYEEELSSHYFPLYGYLTIRLYNIMIELYNV